MRCPLAGTAFASEYDAKVVLKQAHREEAGRREEWMHGFLKGLRVVEGSAFVAAPLAGLTLMQMGAEVIRFDTIGGGPDYTRWPRAGGEEGRSLYWEGLNKGKKSVALDLRSPEGRELAQALVTAPGEGAGLFVTNFPAQGFLSHETLAARRPDLISARVMGWRDGRNAVDYTVNSALGYPMMTGAPDEDGPVNHVMPAWDVATGLYAAIAIIAAERARSRTGEGAELRVPLGDVARATLGNLGQLAEVMLSGADRPRLGNDIFGALGRDFALRDGTRIMLVALTRRQWTDLVRVLGLGPEIAHLEAEIGKSLAGDEGLRFRHRDRLNPIIARALSRLSMREFRARAEGTGLCWAPYQTLEEATHDAGLFSEGDGLFDRVEHASGQSYLTPRSPVSLAHGPGGNAPAARALGADTDDVLARLLGLSDGELGKLHDRGIVAGPRKQEAMAQ